jgi:hypothetical protein
MDVIVQQSRGTASLPGQIDLMLPRLGRIGLQLHAAGSWAILNAWYITASLRFLVSRFAHRGFGSFAG